MRRGPAVARARRRSPSRRRPGTCRSCRRARARPRPSRTGACPTTAATSRASSRSAIVENPRMSENRTVTTTSCGSIGESGCAASRSASCCGTNDASVLREAVCSTTAACSRLNSSTRLEPPLPSPAIRPEQLGHLTIDGLLRRAERLGDLLVAQALGHHVEQLALPIRGVAHGRTAARRSRDRPCCRPRAPRGSRARARRPARSGPSAGRRGRCAPRPSSASAYSSSSCAESTTTPVSGCFDRIACAQSIPSSWKRRRHLDVGDDHVGHVLGRGGEQARARPRPRPTTSMSS